MRYKMRVDKFVIVDIMYPQFHPEKRHDLVLEAFANTLQLIPHAKLLLLGNSGQNKEIIERSG